MTAYYNEFDRYAAAWLRNLIAAGHLPAGEVDERSIVDVRPSDLDGFVQCHFFAGIGGWAYAARLAGWPDDRPIWTGSCPCQPFSVAGEGRGTADERHLWPDFFRLISACRPAVVMGEQVAAAVGKAWLDGVLTDLEGVGYAGRAVVVPACAVNAPHRRDRLWFVADSAGERSPDRDARAIQGHAEPEWQAQQLERRGSEHGGAMADASSERRDGREDAAGGDDAGRPPTGRPEGSGRVELRGEVALADADQPREGEGREQRGRQLGGAGGDTRDRDVGDALGAGLEGHAGHGDDWHEPGRLGSIAAGSIAASGRGAWDSAGAIVGADGKARRVEPGIRLLAHGVPARVGKLRAYGNAIVPQVAAEVIAAYMETRP